MLKINKNFKLSNDTLDALIESIPKNLQADLCFRDKNVVFK